MKVAIASGKGGTGKTFVATNLFNALIRRGHTATLVDCDAEAPNAAAFFAGQRISSEEVTRQIPNIDSQKCTFCGQCSAFCEYNAIFYLPPAGMIKVIDDLCHSCGACSYACQFEAITEKPHVVGELTLFQLQGHASIIEARTATGTMTPVPVIKAALSKSENFFGTIIYDAPPGTSCPFIHTVSNADYVVLVAESTPFGLSDLRQSVATLRQMDKSFGVIVNRAGIGDMAVYHFLEEQQIDLLTQIPFHRKIAGLYSAGKIAGNTMPELEDRLIEMFETKIQKHANCHYQR